jgi:undecaprenyl phosphate N,N'-diacetylbacillosamine 1-phosphate transferase
MQFYIDLFCGAWYQYLLIFRISFSLFIRTGERVYRNYFKNVLDFFLALILTISLAPLFLLCAIFIYFTDLGAVFFLQERLGQKGQSFVVYKFRSMIVNADKFLDSQGKPTRDRITWIGKFLRKTSIDELPQLINILKGEMSFIGPRPMLVAQRHYLKGERIKRLDSKPGISGLAQINGRNTLDWDKRIEYDLAYTKKITFLEDLRIALKTINVVLLSKGVSLDRNNKMNLD